MNYCCVHATYLCRISSKKSEIARVKEQFRSQREETLQEIERLQDALKVLQEEEARKVAELEQEVVYSDSPSKILFFSSGHTAWR